jgi:diguanylate cyclase (GGDEF)-like protein/PAS domain S-box-containing protein
MGRWHREEVEVLFSKARQIWVALAGTVDMFPLFRYFAWLSLGCMILVSVPMGILLHRYSQSALAHIAEDSNVVYARLMANDIWPEYREFLLGAAQLSDHELLMAPQQRELKAKVISEVRDTNILKVRIYNLSGRAMYASEDGRVGQVQTGNPGIESAKKGQVLSTLSFRDSIDSFDRTLTVRDVLSSYVPVRGPDGSVEAVLEIYTDVTEFLGHMASLRNTAATTIGLAISLLYALLALLVWRGSKIIDRQKKRLAELNQHLETRVEERTAELSDANQRLRSEIAERITAETGLQLAATVFENTSEGVMIADREQRIMAVNRAFTKITGYEADEALGKTPRFLRSGRQNEAFYLAFWESLSEHGNWSGEIWNRRKSGELFPEWLSISAVQDENGELTHYVAVFSDITEIKSSQDKLEYLADYDVLTGLPNRVRLGRQLSATIAEAREHRRTFSVLVVDLDHFKHINDTLGHPLGDVLLHKVGEALEECLGTDTLVARVGGDEFVAVLKRTGRSPEEAAQTVLDALRKPFSVDEHMLYAGASIGIVNYPDHGETAESLLSNADAAMYRAKAQGRNGFCVYSKEMSERARDRLALGALLRKSLDEQQLFLQYQPQVELATGRLAGVEALVRMRHPELGVIGPSRFIELAEEDGTIARLGHWVLSESCRAMARWRKAGVMVPKVAVNASVSQLERGNLRNELLALLAENDLTPDMIEIEITEAVIMNAEHAIDKLREIREIGISLAIDDFGTGYSSLSYLRRLPVQKLKIDRAFLIDLSPNGEAATVVRGIVNLARNLGLKTVAEGVETHAQADFLRAEGCDVAQGYLFGRPLDEGDLADFDAQAEHKLERV